MPKKMLLWLIPALVAVLLLQACSQESDEQATSQATSPAVQPPATNTPIPEPETQDQGYPVPGLEIEPSAAYPEPAESDFVDPTNRPELPEVYPTPQEAMGVVSGVVLYDETGIAPPEAVVYLGNMVTTDTGIRVVRLNRDEAAVAIPAADGRFLFPAVEPGEYGLILFHPDISFIIDDPNTGHSLVFIVEPGQSVELDEVTITLP